MAPLLVFYVSILLNTRSNGTNDGRAEVHMVERRCQGWQSRGVYSRVEVLRMGERRYCLWQSRGAKDGRAEMPMAEQRCRLLMAEQRYRFELIIHHGKNRRMPFIFTTMKIIQNQSF